MTSVLYDEPGPRARRRSLIGTVLATLVFAALAVVVLRRLDERGQLSMELWGPFIDPSNEVFTQVWELLAKGLRATLTAAVLAIAFSLVVGTALGVARMMLGRWLRVPLVGIIELLRGLPVIVTIFYVYTLIRTLKIDISALPGEDGLWFLVIGLTLYNSVIIAEILRAGVASLPRGQREAALAVGMTNGQVMRTVLLPQAFRTMLPALISQLVVILKDTSIVAILGLYIELLRQGNLIAQNLDNPIQSLFVVGVIFITINYALSRLAVWTERRLSRSGRGAVQDPNAVSALEPGLSQGT
jgi:glutamate transport system permease protein